MKDKKNIFPLILMLVAGALTGIMAYLSNYEIKEFLLILLLVMLCFYIVGLIILKVLAAFEKKNLEELEKQKAEEGIVVEKEQDGETNNSSDQEG